MHTEAQDTECAGWYCLNELIDDAARDGRHEFSPFLDMTFEQIIQLKTLPASIRKLKSVKTLVLYSSSLVRVPPEIGEMTSLERFCPYTSYLLHWFPYEIRRCQNLRDSTISARALYGNYKFRPPFPKLPQVHPSYLPGRCSVCEVDLESSTVQQAWISLRIGSDVVPLLVHACSSQCLADLPEPPENYVQHPHQGGLDLLQPDAAR